MRVNPDTYHPLHHPRGVCADYPGGKLRHIRLFFTSNVGTRLRNWFHLAFLCRFNLHDYASVWIGSSTDSEPDAYACYHCGQPVPTSFFSSDDPDTEEV